LAAPIRFDQLRVVLVSSRNPLNIGAAARAMTNFGVSRLRVVNPYPMAFRDARSAVGASKVLADAEEFANVGEAVADCRLVVGTTAVGHREPQHPLRMLEQGARLIRKQLRASPVALLFGSEKFGLSNEALSHCQWLMHIPTSEDNISMNLGQAVAVCLYELVRLEQKPSARSARAASKTAGKQAMASSGDMERITAILLDAMVASGYIKRKPTADAEERLRRLVRRLMLPDSDAGAWQGILRQILWKLRQ
jgi:TrmH family RNA methyltransferase